MPAKILIVENEGAIRELYRYIFSELGYEVEVAGNGKEGLKKAEYFQPDFMVLAAAIPGMTTYEFIQKTEGWAVPHIKHVPFVITTGNDSEEDPLSQPFRSDPRCRGMIPKLSNPDLLTKMVQDALQE